MLVLPCEIHHLGHLRFGNLVRGRLLRLRLGLDDCASGWALITAFLDAAHLRSNIYPRLRHYDIGTTAVPESPFCERSWFSWFPRRGICAVAAVIWHPASGKL